MYLPDGASYYKRDGDGLPTPEQLDGSPLFLPYPENPGEGRLTYLPALNLSLLSWWNRVLDTRGAVNSHLMVRREMQLDTMWMIFIHKYATLAGLHTKPIVGRTY